MRSELFDDNEMLPFIESGGVVLEIVKLYCDYYRDVFFPMWTAITKERTKAFNVEVKCLSNDAFSLHYMFEDVRKHFSKLPHLSEKELALAAVDWRLYLRSLHAGYTKPMQTVLSRPRGFLKFSLRASSYDYNQGLS